MNKGDLVDALEVKLGSRKLAVDAVETLVDTIVRTVAKGERVAISGFGTFEKAARARRTGRNPRTGEPVPIPKTNVPKFKAGTAFKAYVAAPRSMPKASATTGAVTSRTTRGVAAAAPTKAAAKKTSKSAAKKTATKAAAKKTATKAPTKRAARKSTK